MNNYAHYFIEMLPTLIQQGLILALVSLGVMIPFRLLNLPDLSSEGAYPFGACVCAALLMMGLPPALCLLLGGFAGGLIGVGTALIHLRFKVNTLLAGIILSTMTYSLNLRLLGKPNVALFLPNNLFYSISENLLLKIIIIGSILLSCIAALLYYFYTESGLRLRAVGFNANFVKKIGISPQTYIILGLFLGNALSGLSGSLMVQVQGYADVNMGFAIVIHALAGLMIGERLLGNQTLVRQLLAPFAGSLCYQMIQGTALVAGFSPTDLKLLTGAMILILLMTKKGSTV